MFFSLSSRKLTSLHVMWNVSIKNVVLLSLSIFVVVFYFITKDVKGNAYLSCLSMLHLVKKAGIGQFVNSWENLKQLMCQIGKSGAAMESSFCVTRANWFENLKRRLHSVNSNNRNFINQCLCFDSSAHFLFCPFLCDIYHYVWNECLHSVVLLEKQSWECRGFVFWFGLNFTSLSWWLK